MPRIVMLSSSRADLGILGPVWHALAADPAVELHIVLTGMHRNEAPPAGAFPARAQCHVAGADLGGAGAATAATAMGAILGDAGLLYDRLMPDCVVVTGDRLDMLPAAVAALPFNVPLVHLHGGEATEGALDDRIRHALTKLAHLHCVATAEAAARLDAMGEEAWRVRVTGAPGLDTLRDAERLGRRDFLNEIGFEAEPETTFLRLATVHPETNAPDPAAPLEAVLAALDAAPSPTLFTAPNSDPGGAALRRRIEDFAAGRPWVRFRATLGGRLYANALRLADVMVGNSSSGIVEAGLFGLAVVDVGARQRGRQRGANVTNVPNEAAAVAAALARLAAAPRERTPSALYGDGRSGPRIAALLANLPDRARLLAKPAPAPRRDLSIGAEA